MDEYVEKDLAEARGRSLFWDTFTNGKTRRCRRGREWEGDAVNFVARARAAARVRNMGCTVRTESDDSVLVQFVPLEDNS